MKILKYIGIFFFMIMFIKCLSSANDDVSAIVLKPQSDDTLHDSNVSDWKLASDKNKQATCEDFVNNIKSGLSSEELKIRANELKICINEATAGSNVMDSEKVTEIAGLCALQMGY